VDLGVCDTFDLSAPMIEFAAAVNRLYIPTRLHTTDVRSCSEPSVHTHQTTHHRRSQLL
jgi:hypothetical protein